MTFSRTLIAAVIVSITSFIAVAPSRAANPNTNFVFLLVDDLGWADVGCNGSTFHETPNIDRLAASGVRFTQAYAACPVCSPTRASIMTGRHPVRVDITDWIPGASGGKNPKLIAPEDRDNLALEETTIAEALKPHGYQTFFAGKWHLGGEGFLPTDQGFDINYGGNHTGSPRGGYYAPWQNPQIPEPGKPGEYLTDRLTDASIDFLRKRDPARPFLLYLAYYNVHTPVQECKEFVQHFKDKAAKMFKGATPFADEHDGVSRMRQDRPDYASMVAAVDKSVGRLLDQLDALKLTGNTVVIFFSDNGGLCTLGAKNGSTCNLPLRSGKGWVYEGGVREPMIVRAPGVTKPGAVCDTPVISMDFFPTMLELAGLPLMPDKHVDGVSLVPLLKGQPLVTDRPIAWHYPHYHGSTWRPGAALREGDWKIVELYEYETVELYNLAEDLGEQYDLSKKNPDKTREMLAKLHAWQQSVGAKMPKPNPNYKPGK
ncbi:MAG: sulfatase-like hydrolase/transferase [Phycisphaera sp.]|nr:sulfatase-like hydrolase/transferase [Phycisphaera sp.]